MSISWYPYTRLGVKRTLIGINLSWKTNLLSIETKRSKWCRMDIEDSYSRSELVLDWAIVAVIVLILNWQLIMLLISWLYLLRIVRSDSFSFIIHVASYHFHWIACMLIRTAGLVSLSLHNYANTLFSFGVLFFEDFHTSFVFQAYDVLGLYYGFGRTFFNPASVMISRS